MSRRKKRLNGRCAARCRSAKSVPLFCACPPHPPDGVRTPLALRFSGAVARFHKLRFVSLRFGGRSRASRAYHRASPSLPLKGKAIGCTYTSVPPLCKGRRRGLPSRKGCRSIERLQPLSHLTVTAPLAQGSQACAGGPPQEPSERPQRGAISIREKCVHLIRLTAYALRLRFVSAEPSRASTSSISLPLRFAALQRQIAHQVARTMLHYGGRSRASTSSASFHFASAVDRALPARTIARTIARRHLFPSRGRR